MLKVTGSRSKVAPRSDHDVAQLGHGRNIWAQFELLPVYGHRDLAQTKWYIIFIRIVMFKVTGSRSMVEPCSDHDISQLHHGRNLCAKFKLLPAYNHRDLKPGQNGSRRPPSCLPSRLPSYDENNTRTAISGCGVKIHDTVV